MLEAQEPGLLICQKIPNTEEEKMLEKKNTEKNIYIFLNHLKYVKHIISKNII